MNWWTSGLIGLLLGAAAAVVTMCVLMATRQATARASRNQQRLALAYQFLRIEYLTTRIEVQLSSIGLSIKLAGPADPWLQIRVCMEIIRNILALEGQELYSLRLKVKRAFEQVMAERDAKTL